MKRAIPYMLAVANMVKGNQYMLPDIKWDYKKNFDRRERYLKFLSIENIEKNIKIAFDSKQKKFVFTGPDNIDIYVSSARNLKRAHQDFRKYLFSLSYKKLGEIEDNYGNPCNDD